MYTVRRQSSDEVLYKSKSPLRCEMVAIGLTLSSLYGTPTTHEVAGKGTVLTTVEPEMAFAMMQTKMRNLVYNKKITKSMPYVPDRFTGLAKTKIIEAVREGTPLNDVKDRLCDEVDEYATYVKNALL